VRDRNAHTSKVKNSEAISGLSGAGVLEHLAPIFETLRGLSKELPDPVTLIGFAGAPWTVATYMVGGRGSPTQAAARTLAYKAPEVFQGLIDLLTQVTADYLIGQVEAGAEVLQIFDTWAGSLSPDQFRRWCIAPMVEISAQVRAKYPDIPIIGFPKGVGPMTLEYVRATGVQGISVDTGMDMNWARETLSPEAVVQGNLDPMLLVAGGPALEAEVMRLLETFEGRPYVFNLGHGIVPETPPEHVDQVVRLVQNR
jgi:uroporphyrinogen decarboxylase